MKLFSPLGGTQQVGVPEKLQKTLLLVFTCGDYKELHTGFAFRKCDFTSWSNDVPEVCMIFRK